MTARRTGLASVATLAALTLTVGVIHAVAPEWSERMGVDVWNLSEVEAEWNRTEEKGRELAAASEREIRQIEASDRVAGELAAGRLSLADAVDELCRVNAGRPAFITCQRMADPDGTERDWVAQYAVAKAVRYPAADPARQADVACRLAAEYAALTGRVWQGDD
jgi:hypothetical protein